MKESQKNVREFDEASDSPPGTTWRSNLTVEEAAGSLIVAGIKSHLKGTAIGRLIESLPPEAVFIVAEEMEDKE